MTIMYRLQHCLECIMRL